MHCYGEIHDLGSASFLVLEILQKMHNLNMELL